MPQPPAHDPADLWAPHYLKHAGIVYARGGNEAPLFLLQAASDLSGDGDQAVFTQLLAYSRRQVLNPAPFDLNDMVERMERVLATALGERIDLTTMLDAQRAVHADAGATGSVG